MDEDKLELLSRLSELLDEENRVEGNGVYLPNEEIYIVPEVGDLNDHGGRIVLSVYFYIYLAGREEPLFECSTAVGQDKHQAISQALAGFMLSAMCAVRHLAAGEYKYEVTGNFADRKRSFHVCESCVVCMGEAVTGDFDCFDVIGSELAAHMGGQKIYWVKTYIAKQSDGKITGECRINDMVSRELSGMLSKAAEEFELNGNFYSRKQFFVFVLDEKDYIPYPHTKEEIEGFVVQAVKLFEQCGTQEQYEHYVDRLAELTGDGLLAVELHSFLPEMCAENQFTEASYSEQITLMKGEERIPVYKQQFTPYYWIQNRLIDGFVKGEFAFDTYKSYIGVSSIYNVLCQAEENGSRMSDISIQTAMWVPENYELR